MPVDTNAMKIMSPRCVYDSGYFLTAGKRPCPFFSETATFKEFLNRVENS